MIIPGQLLHDREQAEGKNTSRAAVVEEDASAIFFTRIDALITM
jgi:hypothetical protein